MAEHEQTLSAAVRQRFALYAGLDGPVEDSPWRVLCDSALADLTRRLRPGLDPESAANLPRLADAAAAMAYHRSCLLGAGGGYGSLTVGEVSLSGGLEGRVADAARLEYQALRSASELLAPRGFAFGGVGDYVG